jgi:hypothetical protein
MGGSYGYAGGLVDTRGGSMSRGRGRSYGDGNRWGVGGLDISTENVLPR